jgi:hypothetical protein
MTANERAAQVDDCLSRYLEQEDRKLDREARRVNPSLPSDAISTWCQRQYRLHERQPGRILDMLKAGKERGIIHLSPQKRLND